MEAVRTKDKLFLAVVVPVALAAAYAYLWRTDAVRQIEAFEREDAALVTVDDFPIEQKRAQRVLEEAQRERDEEARRPMPAAKVKAKAEENLAARERAVLGVFRHAGLAVERSQLFETEDTTARDALSRTGLRPNPVCRQYALVGSYPQVCAALRTFANREMAVIPDKIEMTSARHWSVTLWL